MQAQSIRPVMVIIIENSGSNPVLLTIKQTKVVEHKLKLGANADKSGFGLWASSEGAYCGGFKLYVFGVKGLFNYTIRIHWGGF